MMVYLLDTHVWIWMTSDEQRLGPITRSVLEDPANAVLLSAASSWELALKCQLGKIELPAPPSVFVAAHLRLQGIAPLAVDHAHALAVGDLPVVRHADPFDSLLVAQARVMGLTLVTADDKLFEYDIETLDARN
ncbi:MAG: type II toxin-antitoxin system VapC family toxin [Thermoleophilia bacterium]|nr:type II toxin-antitoxin system VapC family toxin [Thermoleophilia bacterium]